MSQKSRPAPTHPCRPIESWNMGGHSFSWPQVHCFSKVSQWYKHYYEYVPTKVTEIRLVSTNFHSILQNYKNRPAQAKSGKSPILNQFYLDLACLFLHLVSQKMISGLKIWFYLFITIKRFRT